MPGPPAAALILPEPPSPPAAEPEPLVLPEPPAPPASFDPGATVRLTPALVQQAAADGNAEDAALLVLPEPPRAPPAPGSTVSAPEDGAGAGSVAVAGGLAATALGAAVATLDLARPAGEAGFAGDADQPAAGEPEPATTAEPASDPGALAAAAQRPWRDSYPPQVPDTYRYPLVPLTRLLDDAAADFPDTAAVDSGTRGATLRFRQLLDAVDRCAMALAELGVSSGDRVLLALPAWPQLVVALHGAWRIGAVPVLVDPASDEEALAGVIAEAEPVVAIAADGNLAVLAGVISRSPAPAQLVATSQDDAGKTFRGRLPGGRKSRSGVGTAARWADLLAAAAATATQVALDPTTHAAVILRSAGGRSVTLTHVNLLASAFQLRLWVPDVQAGRERLLMAAPPWTAFGLTSLLGLGVLAAATVVLPTDLAPDGLARTVARARPTLAVGDPATLGGLAEAGKRSDLASIRVGLVWGAHLSAEAARAFEARTGGRLRAVYGPAEAGGVTHANPVYGKAKDGTVGLPVTDTDCRLVDPADPDRAAPPGTPGQLFVRGPQLSGPPDRWHPTGDTATIDEEGYLTLAR